MSVELDTDPTRMSVDSVHAWLSGQSYWARGMARSSVAAALASSWSVGAYRDDAQVGVARLVTDGVTYGWLCDVFVAEPARGRGVGRALVGATLDHAAALGLRRVMLATRDAHGLYRSFGFTEPQAGLFMELSADALRARAAAGLS